MKLHSMIMGESSNQLEHHQRFQTYPWNMKLLPSQILQDVSQLNTNTWLCFMTEFSDTDKFE